LLFIIITHLYAYLYPKIIYKTIILLLHSRPYVLCTVTRDKKNEMKNYR
jgi:hypothetical protein